MSFGGGINSLHLRSLQCGVSTSSQICSVTFWGDSLHEEKVLQCCHRFVASLFGELKVTTMWSKHLIGGK